jgi:hypothetical protein
MSTLKHDTLVQIYAPGRSIFTISPNTLLLPLRVFQWSQTSDEKVLTGHIPVHYRSRPIQGEVILINAQTIFLIHKSIHRGTTSIVSMLNASTVKTLLPVGCFCLAWLFSWSLTSLPAGCVLGMASFKGKRIHSQLLHM